MTRKYIRREEVDRTSTRRTRHDLDPEVIENVNDPTVREARLIKLTNCESHVSFDRFEDLNNLGSKVNGYCIANSKVCNWINVTSNCPRTQLQGLADRCTASHKWIKDDRPI